MGLWERKLRKGTTDLKRREGPEGLVPDCGCARGRYMEKHRIRGRSSGRQGRTGMEWQRLTQMVSGDYSLESPAKGLVVRCQSVKDHLKGDYCLFPKVFAALN
jgi:hypothetical protein